MSQLQVDSLTFIFAPNVKAQRYDQWNHYRLIYNARGTKKAMDVVAVDHLTATRTTWLIEAKDFRVITRPPKPCNLGGLAQTIADKVADTLTGLRHASTNATAPLEKQHAFAAMTASTKRIVLHLEPHTGQHTKLFPYNFSTNVHQKLKQLVSATDRAPLVLNITNTPAAGVPWKVL
jgi:hypothetical protein